MGIVMSNLFQNVFMGIAAAAERRQKGGDVYMGEDGYLHCAVCHEPIEAEFPEEIKHFFPEGKRRPRMCKCDRDRDDAEKAEQKRQEALMRIEELRNEGMYSDLYRDCRFDKDDRRTEKVSRIARKYADNFAEYADNNVGIMFWGGFGTGKTFYAACIANALIEQYRTVIMATVTDLVSELTEDYGQNREWVLRKVSEADLLILDDLGVERGTEYMQEHVYDIVNARCNANKPLIVTTNLSPSDMERETVDIKRRTYDRVRACCSPIKVDGESRRKDIGKEKTALLRKLLEESE